jgi:hypothetical protein
VITHIYIGERGEPKGPNQPEVAHREKRLQLAYN